MKLFTIGFTRKSAEKFFTTLREAGVQRILDVRLNNVSQLAGFAKRDDLRFFSKQLCNAGYMELPQLAPTGEMLSAYRKRGGDWPIYERAFLDLMKERRVEETVDKRVLDQGCLLCSEDKPHHCHRRLVAEYLKQVWPDIEITHLM